MKAVLTQPRQLGLKCNMYLNSIDFIMKKGLPGRKESRDRGKKEGMLKSHVFANFR